MRASATAVPGAGAVSIRGSIVGAVLSGNLLGAVVTFLYFRFIDFSALTRAPVSPAEIAFFVAGFAFLAAVGIWRAILWLRPLAAWIPPAAGAPEPPDAPLVRRQAVGLPYLMAWISAVGWVLAGIIWGVLWPLLAGSFSPLAALRSMFGITIVAGSVTTATIFLAIEHRWRRVLPRFFPRGDVGAVTGVPRVRVQTRLVVVFLLTGFVPMAIVGVLCYTRAAAMLEVDPATAASLLDSMLVFILFVLSVGGLTAVGLAVFVSRSVAVPLEVLAAAMREVEQGILAARCPVVSNDELGAVTEGFNRMLEGLRERELIRETFGKYVTREVRDEILAGRVTLGGQVVETTILFADLRDFTPWVEATDPREVVRDLNAYFTLMEGAIREQGGIVLQFIGDEIEAVFGAPVPHPEHADLAVRAALEMRRRLAGWNVERRAAARALFRHGIGIHTGRVRAGNIGSPDRLSWTLVGDAVNLASRIQDLTKELGAEILVSRETRRRLDRTVVVEPLPSVRVKGKSAEVEVYRVA